MRFHATINTATSIVPWLLHLGGPGLVLLGIADSSVVPLTGSMDVATIWLAASQPHLWPYYAAMATVGALVGGHITYSLARKGGKEALERKLGTRRASKVYKKFEHHGFGVVAVPALLPPPFPIVPFLLAAGALQYPRKRFLTALAVGRSVRFTAVALLGALYGPWIVAFMASYYRPALFILLGLAVIGGIVSLGGYLKARSKRNA